MILVGLMSGTSLDGISAAVVRFTERGARIGAELLAYEVLAYDEERRARLGTALRTGTPEDYCRLNFDLGAWLADAAERVIAASGVPRAQVAGVASHGQTIWHVPGHSTWQLGEAAVLAERLELPVISDFRVRDMAAGGQGAPLVSIADTLLFAADGHWRILQNLGGIGNLTVVPPGGGGASPARAFDTGPGVVVIDGVTRMVAPELPYDVDGRLARQGTPIHAVVERALAGPYFAAPPPKSTGRELFTPGYVAAFAGWCREARPGASGADLVATAVAVTAHSIADALRRFVGEPVHEMVVSGGGAKNPALVEAIADALGGRPRVVRFDDLFFDGEAKEAVAFALMGYLHLQSRPGNVPSATGARGPRILGKLSPP